MVIAISSSIAMSTSAHVCGVDRRIRWRAEGTIPRGARSRATESECEQPADLFGHDPMGRQLAARHRDEAVGVPEYRVIPRNVRFRFLRSAFAEEGTQACVGAHDICRA